MATTPPFDIDSPTDLFAGLFDHESPPIGAAGDSNQESRVPVGSNTRSSSSLVTRKIWQLNCDSRSLANVTAVEDVLLTMPSDQLNGFLVGDLLKKCFANPVQSLILSDSPLSREWQVSSSTDLAILPYCTSSTFAPLVAVFQYDSMTKKINEFYNIASQEREAKANLDMNIPEGEQALQNAEEAVGKARQHLREQESNLDFIAGQLEDVKNSSAKHHQNMLEAYHSAHVAAYLSNAIRFYHENTKKPHHKQNLPLANLGPDERVDTLQALFGVKEYADIVEKFPTFSEHILLSRQLVNLGFTESKAYEKYLKDGHELSFRRDKIQACREHTARLFGLVKPAPEPKNKADDGASSQTPRKRKSVPGSPAASSQKKQQQFAAFILGSPQMKKVLNDNPDLVAQARTFANYQAPPSKDQSPGGDDNGDQKKPAAI